MHHALSRTDHRPWPLPSRAWRWRQSWCDLLFAHWPVPTRTLQPLVPDGLEVEEFEGTSWIGVVPFRMEGVMHRPLPDMPFISAFPELNLRLYVQVGGKPGVFFLSLDAANALAVWAGRRLFHLPYFRSRSELHHEAEAIRFESRRCKNPSGLAFASTYQPESEPYESTPGSLEHWLTERYCLYAQSPRGELFRTEVHHHPWPLQRAKAEIDRNELFSPHGLRSEESPPLLHFSRRVDVVAWSPERVGL